MTWRLAIDRWRADHRGSGREQVAGGNSPGLDLDEEAVRAGIGCSGKAIDALPGKLRSVLILAAVQGHDVREVAQLLGSNELMKIDVTVKVMNKLVPPCDARCLSVGRARSARREEGDSVLIPASQNGRRLIQAASCH